MWHDTTCNMTHGVTCNVPLDSPSPSPSPQPLHYGMINYRLWTDRITKTTTTLPTTRKTLPTTTTTTLPPPTTTTTLPTTTTTTPRFQVHFLHPVSVDAMILESTSSQNWGGRHQRGRQFWGRTTKWRVWGTVAQNTVILEHNWKTGIGINCHFERF